MRITLNLATKPWVDTGTQVKRLRNALAVLASVSLLCLLGLHFESSAAQHAQQKRDAMDAEQAKLIREKSQYEAQLALPKNQAILERAQFLNGVFAEKSFSWTAVMMDLENVLPGGVQVASLDPQVMPTGSIVIRLRVRGDRDRAVDLIRNLEKSKRFLTPSLAAEATESQNGGQGGQGQQVGFDPNAPVAFEILADYNPVVPEKQKAQTKLSKEATTEKNAAKKTQQSEPTGTKPVTGKKSRRGGLGR
jgi:type IV pilus assembly protein PilN